jgi:hypothetical protein
MIFLEKLEIRKIYLNLYHDFKSSSDANMLTSILFLLD